MSARWWRNDERTLQRYSSLIIPLTYDTINEGNENISKRKRSFQKRTLEKYNNFENTRIADVYDFSIKDGDLNKNKISKRARLVNNPAFIQILKERDKDDPYLEY
jgi:hypothetical protein